MPGMTVVADFHASMRNLKEGNAICKDARNIQNTIVVAVDGKKSLRLTLQLSELSKCPIFSFSLEIL